MTPPPRGRPARTRELLSLAWPAVLSYILNNAYRINDQFWIQGLGDKAQAAIGATFFVQVMNFAAIFLAVGGTLALVARSTGARDPELRDSYARHALGFGLCLGLALTALILPLVDEITGLLGLRDEAARHAADYLTMVACFLAPLAVFPVVDTIFIARGNTRVPMALQACAVGMNYFLNPLLIYGADAASEMPVPGAAAAGWVAGALGIEGMGLRGAALATGLARITVAGVGLLILNRAFGMRILAGMRPRLSRVLDIARISAPVSVSIAIYALAYWGLLGLVLGELGEEVTAALGIGFQVFEGVAFPCYLGVSIAASSLVGREIGARNRDGVLEVVRSARLVSRFTGLFFAAVFLFGGSYLLPLFTEDSDVARATGVYVRVLALSQYWVAVEAVNEKVLLGAGHTRPILWIAPTGNLLRVPLAWLLALVCGLGGAGVWWAVNLTTYLKAFLLWRKVQRGTWLDEALSPPSEEESSPA